MIVDSHTLLRTVLAAYLSETKRFKVVSQVAAATDAIAYFAHEKIPSPDAVLIDMEADVDCAIKFIEWIKPKTTHLLVYSDYTSHTHVNAAAASGAAGFVGKNESEDILRYALEQIAKGKNYFSETAMKKISSHSEWLAQFTVREQKALALAQQGYTNSAIAEALSLSAHTVENYMSNLYAKTGAQTRELLQGL
jgi:DNA-binding NarL/FixJ family response regulator